MLLEHPEVNVAKFPIDISISIHLRRVWYPFMTKWLILESGLNFVEVSFSDRIPRLIQGLFHGKDSMRHEKLAGTRSNSQLIPNN